MNMSSTRSTSLPGISLRPYEEHDLEFLASVYATSRSAEMALVKGWSEPQKQEFLNFQFWAQHKHYQEHYANARYDIIVKDGVDIGRFYVEPMPNEILVIDITLLPEFRRHGIGGALMRELLGEAVRTDRFVSLHVEEYNPGRRLYERLGFQVVGDVSFYKLMHWLPPGRKPADAGSVTPEDSVN